MVFRNPHTDMLEEDPVYASDGLTEEGTPNEMPGPPNELLSVIPSNPLISKNSVVIKNYGEADSDSDTDSF